MENEPDAELIGRFILVCSKKHMTLERMARTARRSRSWASRLVNGKIARLHFSTRNRILEYLGEL